MNNPKILIIEAVLESAFDGGAELYVAACRRLLRANLRSWRSHADVNDWRLVLEAYEELRDDETDDTQIDQSDRMPEDHFSVA